MMANGRTAVEVEPHLGAPAPWACDVIEVRPRCSAERPSHGVADTLAHLWVGIGCVPEERRDLARRHEHEPVLVRMRERKMYISKADSADRGERIGGLVIAWARKAAPIAPVVTVSQPATRPPTRVSTNM